ncbi:MAG: PEP/pyruvate-binding domain-containing protein, partial [Bacteroides sp.]|nr:PEP/pyruvate-binding domain-containing protein [Bacteroides sp.]
MKYTYKLEELDNSNVKEVGGKNASLGEMFSSLASKGIRVPDGFATSAKCYWEYLEKNDLKEDIEELLSNLDSDNLENLEDTSGKIREKIMEGQIPEEIEKEIKKAYEALKEREKKLGSVAVRSSATAEDLPDASFAGQHESYMNIRGMDQLLKAWKKCVASLFTDRAIKYRLENGFEHMKVALSVGVQKMVRSDKASSGVMFTIDTET